MKAIDFEFFGANEPHPTLVCAAFDFKKYWLLDNSDAERLKADLLNNEEPLLAYYAIAEARSLLALGINPLTMQWVDLYVEFRMLCNSNNKWEHGRYIDKFGNIKSSEPWTPELKAAYKAAKGAAAKRAVKGDRNFEKTPKNMINCVFKTTGEIISSNEKEEMRTLILSKDISRITQSKERIMDYCLDDTRYLEKAHKGVCKAYTLQGLSNFEKDMLSRGSYAAATAKCEQLGIPINVKLLDKIIEKTPDILDESKDRVNEVIEKLVNKKLFIPEFQPAPKLIKKTGELKQFKLKPGRKSTQVEQELIASLNLPDWPKTPGGAFCTKAETLTDFSTYPGISTLLRHNSLATSLNWFNRGNGDGFFGAFGSDHCVRPFFGIFGTQTGRNAAKAKTFPFAMSSWLRAIIQPPPGEYIIGADFSQQEVAVAAWLSQDKAMIDAYNSGDVYLEFAFQAGLIKLQPKSFYEDLIDGVTIKTFKQAQKAFHAAERELCKALVLGLQYGMGKYLLQTKLSHDTGSLVSLDKTIELIDAHKSVFHVYWSYIYDLSHKYQNGYPIITADGWVMWQDNMVMTSVRNSPFQGTGASITRQATVDAWQASLLVMNQLHDAIYARTTNPVQDELILRAVMRKATQKILGENCIDIRVDTKIISSTDIFMEKKGEAQWQRVQALIA